MPNLSEINWEKIKNSRNWADFISYCQELNYGRVFELLIEDGIPIFAREERKDIRFGKDRDDKSKEAENKT